jgi:REP element-mobilizing transposase RayT
MARPLRIVYPGAFYHVTSRGNEQKDVFKSRRDREKFLEYLGSATQRYGAVIHGYCQMSNHYHLLLETPAGNLSQIMQHINSAYTTYFNVKRKRAGHLFQGRYKAILVEADEYATELSRYIHLNPVKAAMAARPEDWPWSSYRAFIGQGRAPDWLKREYILGYFGKKAADAEKKYRAFVEDRLGKAYESPLQDTFGTAILGSAEFVEAITAEHLTTREIERDLPALRQFVPRPALDEILSAVSSVISSDEKLARQAGMYLCHRYSGEKLRTIGDLYNVRESAISEASRLFPRKMERDEKLGKSIEKIKGELNI